MFFVGPLEHQTDNKLPILERLILRKSEGDGGLAHQVRWKQAITILVGKPPKSPAVLLPRNCKFFWTIMIVWLRSSSLFWIVLALCTASLGADNWPGWRGPDRCGISEDKGIPTKWSPADGIAWKAALPGNGVSSPVVWGDKIFVTASDTDDPSELHIVALNRQDGSKRWHLRLWGTSPTRYHATKSSMASATPVTDGQHVFAFFGTGDVFCVDVDGHMAWHRSLASENGSFENRFSATSSPLLYRDLLVVQCDHYGDSYALAMDKESGENRWKVARPKTWLSWSSPQLAPVEDGKKYELVLCSSLRIDGLDPETGRKLWTMGGMQRECIPTPVLGHQMI